MIVAPGASFESVADLGQTGLVGTVAWQLVDNVGGVVVPPSTAAIVETPAGSGVYAAVRTAPGVEGQYTIVWSSDGTFAPGTTAVEDLVVSASLFVPQVPTDPVPGAPSAGPCTAWISESDVAECCDLDSGSIPAGMARAAVAATEVLFELSGRRFPGACAAKVRPCRRQCRCWGAPWGQSMTWDGDAWLSSDCAHRCGCGATSEVMLPSYPVNTIVEVKVDGVVIPASQYRLDYRQVLVRLADPAQPSRRQLWPSCQDLTLDDDQPGTWSIRYTWGMAPPEVGKRAAAQLACHLWRACSGAPCALPAGVIRLQRQGVTVERQSLVEALGSQPSGLELVDAFLAAYGHRGYTAAVWSPDIEPLPRPILG